jgi:hypothetical protein
MDLQSRKYELLSNTKRGQVNSQPRVGVLPISNLFFDSIFGK